MPICPGQAAYRVPKVVPPHLCAYHGGWLHIARGQYRWSAGTYRSRRPALTSCVCLALQMVCSSFVASSMSFPSVCFTNLGTVRFGLGGRMCTAASSTAQQLRRSRKLGQALTALITFAGVWHAEMA